MHIALWCKLFLRYYDPSEILNMISQATPPPLLDFIQRIQQMKFFFILFEGFKAM